MSCAVNYSNLLVFFPGFGEDSVNYKSWVHRPGTYPSICAGSVDVDHSSTKTQYSEREDSAETVHAGISNFNRASERPPGTFVSHLTLLSHVFLRRMKPSFKSLDLPPLKSLFFAIHTAGLHS